MRHPSALDILLLIALGLIVVGLVGITRAEDRYVLCIEGVGPACDTSETYAKSVCASLPQMSGWAPGTNPFYCKPLGQAEGR
jgi:hypothetical protein